MFPFPNLIVPAPIPSTWNPADKSANMTLSNGNLTATLAAASTLAVRGSGGRSSGQYHFEVTVNTNGGSGGVPNIGVADSTFVLGSTPGVNTHCIQAQDNGQVFFNNAGSSCDTYTTGAVLAIEVDLGTSQFWIQKSGGTGRKGPFSMSGIGLPVYPFFSSFDNSDAVTLNVGATAFTITPTSGFAAWG